MTTQAQIEANRKNAQKSTGPKSRQGKEAVSQNAVKHGLCANKHVIRSESQEEFDEFRQNMIADLEPVGAMEKMLADRIVSLSWRLKRAEQFQNLAIESLIEFNLNDGWYRGDSARREADKGNLELIIGFAINRDFAEARTLDLLLMYERRIESSLYKASTELRKMQRMRRKEGKRETVSRASCPRLHEQEAEAAESMDMKKEEDRKIRSEEDKRGEKEFDLENQSQFDSAEFGVRRSANDNRGKGEVAAHKQDSREGHPHPDKLHRDEDATRISLQPEILSQKSEMLNVRTNEELNRENKPNS